MKKFSLLLPIFIVFFFFSYSTQAQEKRIKRPKKCNVKNVDVFVGNTFKMYRKVYVYDSLTVAGVEIPEELENEIFESMEQDVDSMIQVVPDIWDDIKQAPILKKAKASLNMGRAVKALNFSVKKVKAYTLGEGTKDEEDEEDDYYDDGKY